MTTTDETTQTDLISAKELALLTGVNAKAMRRFIRNQDEGCGKGNRYGFTPTEAKSLIAAYRTNQANRSTTATPTRSLDELNSLIDDIDDIDDNDDNAPIDN